jgi:hypothetical protein
MGTMIHAREREDGEWRYRFWSTVTDCYYTPELTAEQMARWVVEYGISRDLSSVGINLGHRFNRARENGTSAFDASRKPDSWDEIRDEWGEDNPHEDPAPWVDDTEVVTYLAYDSVQYEPTVIAGKAVKITYRVELVDPEEAREALAKKRNDDG